MSARRLTPEQLTRNALHRRAIEAVIAQFHERGPIALRRRAEWRTWPLECADVQPLAVHIADFLAAVGARTRTVQLTISKSDAGR